MSEHTPWCCDGYAAFCPLCPRPTDQVRCLGHAYGDRNRETVRVSRLHAQRAHPDFEYRTTEGARKQFDASVPPADENGDPDPTWEVNVDAGRDGWERFDYTEEAYWRRPKRKTGGPCARPECGGVVHTDPWGTSVQCPHAEPVVQADTGRRCPRCDCPDGHEQCDHCKTCPHAGSASAGDSSVFVDGTTEWASLSQPAPTSIQIMGENNEPLVTIYPNGALDYGANYSPDKAARCFWEALRRLAPTRCPSCGYTGLEAP